MWGITVSQNLTVSRVCEVNRVSEISIFLWWLAYWPAILMSSQFSQRWLAHTIVLTVTNKVLKNIFSRNWKTKRNIFLLIKTMRVASTSISNCCLIFGNVSTSESARTIFDLPWSFGIDSVTSWSMSFLYI